LWEGPRDRKGVEFGSAKAFRKERRTTKGMDTTIKGCEIARIRYPDEAFLASSAAAKGVNTSRSR
jgi:hypothetical protein